MDAFPYRILKLSRTVVAMALITVSLSACVSTSLIDHWQDPSYSGPPLHKVLVVGIQRDAGRRRLWEDGMVAALMHQGVQASASWTVFPSKAPTPDELSTTAEREGFDGVLASHFIRAGQRTYWEPGLYGPGYVGMGFGWGWPYFGDWNGAYGPGYPETEELTEFQTDVFTVDSNGGKLIWTGITRSVDLSATHSITGQMSRVLVPELVKARILAGKSS